MTEDKEKNWDKNIILRIYFFSSPVRVVKNSFSPISFSFLLKLSFWLVSICGLFFPTYNSNSLEMDKMINMKNNFDFQKRKRLDLKEQELYASVPDGLFV